MYDGDEAGVCYAVETEGGRVRWRYRTGGAIEGGLAVADGAVYVGSD